MEIGIQTSAVRHIQTPTMSDLKPKPQANYLLLPNNFDRQAKCSIMSSMHVILPFMVLPLILFAMTLPSTAIASTKPKVFVIGLSKTGTTSLVCIIPTDSN
jgi:hypothetical protein